MAHGGFQEGAVGELGEGADSAWADMYLARLLP